MRKKIEDLIDRFESGQISKKDTIQRLVTMYEDKVSVEAFDLKELIGLLIVSREWQENRRYESIYSHQNAVIDCKGEMEEIYNVITDYKVLRKDVTLREAFKKFTAFQLFQELGPLRYDRHNRYDYILDKFVQDVTEKDLTSIPRVGKRTWEKYKALVENFKETRKDFF